MSVKRLDGRNGLIIRGEKYLEIPKGPESSRPELGTGAREGMIRFNTDTNIYEGFNGTTWVSLVSGAWTIIDASVTTEYMPATGEQVLVDTASAAQVCEIRLDDNATEGNSIRVADSGYAGSTANSNIRVVSYPNNDDLQTPTFDFLIENSNSEVTFVFGEIDGNFVWTKIDLETFIANGTTKLEIADPNVDAVLTGGGLILQDGAFTMNGAADFNINDGDINIASGHQLSVSSSSVLTETELTTPKVEGLVYGSIANPTDAINKQYADEIKDQLIIGSNVGNGLNLSGTAPSHTLSVEAESNGGLTVGASGIAIDIQNLADGSNPADTDELIMEVSGSLVRVTRGELLDGLGAPRAWQGTVALDDGGVDTGTTTIGTVDATGGSPSPSAGDEFTVSNGPITDNTITGSSESFATGDSIVWNGTDWVKLTASSTNLVTSVFGRTGAISAQSGDYPASLIPLVDTTFEDVDDLDLQNAIDDLDIYKASRRNDNVFISTNTFGDVSTFNADLDINASVDISADLTMSDAGSQINVPNGTRTATSLAIGSTDNGLWREGLYTGDVNISSSGEVVSIFYRDGSNSSGLLLTEQVDNTSAPTIHIVNTQSDTLPRNADIYIQNNLPNISLKNNVDTNIISIESSPGSTLETFAISTRSHSSNQLGNKVSDLLQANTTKFEIYSQLYSTSGTPSEPGMSFKDTLDTGLSSIEETDPNINNKLQIIAGGENKITVQNDYYNGGANIYNSSVVFEGPGSIKIPDGTTAERPLLPGTGGMRFNTSINQFEGFDGGQWKPLAELSGTGAVEWFYRNANVTVLENFGYAVDTTSGPITITLPGDPSPNEFVWIADYAGTSAGNPITIKSADAPGMPGTPDDRIMGELEDLEISTRNAVVRLTYIDSVVGWKITSGLAEFAGSDAINWEDPETANFTAEPFKSYMVDTTGGVVTVTLPAPPGTQDEFKEVYVRVADYAGASPTSPITVNTNGEALNGELGEDHTIRTANAVLTFQYIDGTQGWKITSGSGAGSAGISSWEFVDSNVTTTVPADSSIAYMIDTTVDAVTVTLPATPAQFDIIHIMDHKGTASVNPITINGNSKLIVGSVEDLVINLDRAMVQLTYLGDSDDQGWVVTNGIGEGGGGGLSQIWNLIDIDTNLYSGGAFMADTRTQPLLLSLPISPQKDTTVFVSDYFGTASVNNITIQTTDSELIMGDSSDLVLDLDNSTVQLTYIDSNVGWKIVDGIGEGGSNLSQNWEHINTNETLEPSLSYMVDTRINPVTLILPSNPNPNNTLFIADYFGTSSSNTITVQSIDGNPIMGLNEDLIINLDNASIQLTYLDSTVGWKIVDGIGEGTYTPSSLDTINEVITLSSGQTSVTFTNITETAETVFYINGIALYPPTDGYVGDYLISGPQSILLMNTFPDGSLLLGIQNEVQNVNPSIWSFMTLEEEGTLSSGQDTITTSNVSTTYPYSVYINGVRLAPSERSANSETEIQLVLTYPAGSTYVVVQNDPIGS